MPKFKQQEEQKDFPNFYFVTTTVDLIRVRHLLVVASKRAPSSAVAQNQIPWKIRFLVEPLSWPSWGSEYSDVWKKQQRLFNEPRSSSGRWTNELCSPETPVWAAQIPIHRHRKKKARSSFYSFPLPTTTLSPSLCPYIFFKPDIFRRWSWLLATLSPSFCAFFFKHVVDVWERILFSL